MNEERINKERMGEIALLILEYRIAKEGISLSEINRELGNIAKAINVPLDELKKFSIAFYEELLEKILNK